MPPASQVRRLYLDKLQAKIEDVPPCENNRDYMDEKGVTRMRLQSK